MKTAGAPRRIIVADGDEVIGRDIATFLSSLGYEVKSVKTAGELLAALNETPSAAAVMDFYLPDTNGVEIINRVRQGSPEIAVIMMMSDPTVDTVIAAFRKGASDFLIKPFEAGEMRQVIEGAIAKFENKECGTGLHRETETTRDPAANGQDGRSSTLSDGAMCATITCGSAADD
jgi:DNA-binding NtrC family response regulator